MLILNRKFKFMKSQILWISIALAVYLGSTQLTQRFPHQPTMAPHQSSNSFNFIFARQSDPSKPVPISFDVLESDVSHFQTILNPLVGTLVKYTSSGKIEGYLAERWTVTNDGHQWAFVLRDNLICEDGQHIDAPSFIAQFTENLRRYSQKTSPIDFANLIGWTEFQNNRSSTIKGIQATSKNTITFNFNHRPEDLLELLRMPYFGYWCKGNFENGKWANKHKIVSSGAYYLDKIENGHEITLKARNNWFSIASESPKEIRFNFLPLSEAVKSPERTLIKVGYSLPVESEPEGFYLTKGPPTILSAFTLSPFKDGFFKDPDNRRAFQERVMKLLAERDSSYSPFFYPTATSPLSDEKFNLSYKRTKISKITLALPSAGYSKSEVSDLKSIVDSALVGSGVTSDIIIPNAPDESWRSKLASNREFDLRITPVDIGGHIQNFVVNMMFCTNMGVTFPDPSHRICQLVKDNEKADLPITQKYIDDFNGIIRDDACVIPLFHKGDKWLATKDIDPTSIPSIVVHPRFESIRLKR